jgi:hypothetical protein
MTSATWKGRSSIARWQVFKIVVRAPIVAASVSSRSGGIVRSRLAMMRHEGLVFQAGEMASRLLLGG